MAAKRSLFLASFAVTLLCALECDAQQSREPTSEERHVAIYAPRPDYPLLARRARYTGSGLFILNIDNATGVVRSITIGRSTGYRILDWAAMDAFIKWRFKPSVTNKVKIPVTFTMSGWRY